MYRVKAEKEPSAPPGKLAHQTLHDMNIHAEEPATMRSRHPYGRAYPTGKWGTKIRRRAGAIPTLPDEVARLQRFRSSLIRDFSPIGQTWRLGGWGGVVVGGLAGGGGGGAPFLSDGDVRPPPVRVNETDE